MTGTVPDLPHYRLTATHADGQAVLAVSGELDLATVEEFGASVREHLAVGPVLLDLHELSFMDSSGVRVLNGLLRDAERENWSLVIQADLHDRVRQVLEMTGMLGMLPLRDSPTPQETR
jgi:anti-anti-sigma factor